MNKLTLSSFSKVLLLSSLVALTACGGGSDGSSSNSGGSGSTPDVVTDPTPSVITGDSTGTDNGSGTIGGVLALSGDDTFIAIASATENYGSFTIDETGNWTYNVETLSDSVVALGADETATDQITVSTVDGLTQNITVTVVGVDDAPVIGTGTGVDSATIASGSSDPEIGGTLTIDDPDNGESVFIAQSNTAGTYGLFSIEADGDWTYTLNTSSSSSIVQITSDNTVSATSATDDKEESFAVSSVDGTTHNVVILVTDVITAPSVPETPAEVVIPTEPTEVLEVAIISASDDGTHNTDQGPENAIDEDTDSDSRWSSEGSGKELELDLGSSQTVGALQILWLKGNERESYFNIAVLADMDNATQEWVTVFENQQSSSGNDSSYEIVNFPQLYSASKVKIIGYGNSDDNSLWNSVIEIEVYNNYLTEVIVPELPGGEIDYTIIYDSNDAAPCDDNGQILYDGICADYTAVYEEEHGVLNEGAYLVSSDPIEMTFDALAAQEITPNGNGWRHELKIKSSGGYRVAMTEVYELFKAKIKVELDPGAKTIVAQHHADTTDTITKLYIADLDESGFENAPDGSESDSEAMNGIFDVYIRLAKEDGSGETKHLLTTIESGESFDFEEENNHGVITVKINGQALASITTADSSASYFKFGNYLQAQYPEDIGDYEIGDKLASGDADGDWADFYAQYFSTSKITFTEMSYIRTVD